MDYGQMEGPNGKVLTIYVYITRSAGTWKRFEPDNITGKRLRAVHALGGLFSLNDE